MAPTPARPHIPRPSTTVALAAAALLTATGVAQAEVGLGNLLTATDIPGETEHEVHAALTLAQFEALVNGRDAATRKADAARLTAAGYVSGGFGQFSSTSLGLVGTALVELRGPEVTAAIARWEAASARSEGITFSRARLAPFENGWLLTARRTGTKRVVGYAVIFTKGRFVSQTLIANTDRVLKRGVAIRLATIARSRIPD